MYIIVYYIDIDLHSYTYDYVFPRKIIIYFKYMLR